jgi:cardiolipin synthase
MSALPDRDSRAAALTGPRPFFKQSRLRPLLCVTLSVGLAACASVPDFDQMFDKAAETAPNTGIVGMRGPLTAKQSKAVLARLGLEPGDAGLLQRHLAIEQAVAESPLVAGNRTHVLRDGTQSFRAMFAAMQGAKHHINLEYYILEDVESDGMHLGDLLVAKRQAGVAVNVIYDSYGSGDTPAAFFDRLKQAGVNIVEFNPVNPLDAKTGYSLNDRDHRKILVVDGATAIVGGVNLSKTYQSHPFGKSGAPEGTPEEYWRDTDLAIDGPVVAQLQQLFLDHWATQKGPPLTDASFFPAIPPGGTGVVRIIGSTPDKAIPRYYVTLLSAIRNAEKSVYLSAAYFVPTEQELADLTDAARRGIDVRLLLPDKSDSETSIAIAHGHYAELLKAGVRIYETHGLVLHSKTVVIDGVWSVIGSSNFDQRSVLFNDEVDAVVLGSETALELQQMFESDQQKAQEVDRKMVVDRPFFEKIKGAIARFWQNLL